jgi:hypothetical protein
LAGHYFNGFEIMKKIFFALFLLASLTNTKIMYSKLQIQSRAVGVFDKIFCKGPGKLVVKQKSQSSFQLEADETILQSIQSIATYNVLYLLNHSGQEPVTFSIGLKNISLIEIQETLTLEINNFKLNNSLLVRISPSSEQTHKLVIIETPVIENAITTHHRNDISIKAIDEKKIVNIKKLIITTEKI